MDTIAEMTRDELHAFVDRVIQDRESRLKRIRAKDNRSPAEILRSINENRLPTPPGVPTPTQILQEERDKWYNP